MVRGRKADLPAVKRAKGNPARRPIREKAPGGEEPTPVAKDGKLPDWVNTAKAVRDKAIPNGSKGAKQRASFMTALTEQIWNFIRPELVKMKLAQKLDEPALAIWCRSFAEYIAAIIELDRDGMTYTTESAHSGVLYRPHPALRVRKDALQSIREMGDMLGITPLSRARLFQMMADGSRGQLPLNDPVAKPEEGGLVNDSPIGALGGGTVPTQH